MKTIFIALLTTFALMLSGCAGFATTGPAPTPAQIVDQFCPSAQTLIIELQAMPTLPQKDQDNLAKAAPIVAAVCSAGATVSVASLQDFAKSTLPTILTMINGSSLPDADKTRVTILLLTAQVAIGAVR